jgi:hypothetical protein
MNYKNKKITLTLLLISIVTIIFFSILQEKKRVYSYDEYGREVYVIQRVVEFLNIQFSYNNSLFFLFLLTIIIIIALFFTNDKNIKNFIHGLTSKLSGFKKYFNLFINIRRVIFYIILLIIVLFFIGKCAKTIKDFTNEKTSDTIKEIIDTVAVVDSASISTAKIDSASSYENSNTDLSNEEQGTINTALKDKNISTDELAKIIDKAVKRTEIGKATKGTFKEFQSSDYFRGIDTDQLQKVGGDAAQSLNSDYLNTAGNILSNRQSSKKD